MNNPAERLILLAGATGYVGGRLLSRLENDGHKVRCMARRPAFLQNRVSSNTKIVKGDVLDLKSLEVALSGVHTAYYLVHSMGAPGEFEEQDRRGANNFGIAAARCGVKQIIYLGALANPDAPALSVHLRSRLEVGRLLTQYGVPVIEFRASIILGNGSLSFELVRSLVERLPIMVTPKWVRVLAQPIGIEDVLQYLLAALTLPKGANAIYEIGGSEQVSYMDLMREYARQQQLRRIFIPVPVLSPRISSLWLGLVTPVYARIGRTLIEGIRNSTVIRDGMAARKAFDISPDSPQRAIELAIQENSIYGENTRWFAAESSAGFHPSDMDSVGYKRIIDSRISITRASTDHAFSIIESLGGANGWLFLTWAWSVRGFLDLLFGGVGVRRGRPHPTKLQVGDTVDWWRVESIDKGKSLRLRAEMLLPGRAWLEFEVSNQSSITQIRQTAIYDAAGISGLLYWYLLYPAHIILFTGMLRRITAEAEKL